MHADFLAAICAEPDDLAHRLVYADWLEEHGTTTLDAARAELIRVQIAREASDPDGDDHWALRARERVLLATWGKQLAGPAHRLARRYRFRRGFVEWIEVSCEDWMRHFTRHGPLPAVRAIQFTSHPTTLTPDALVGVDALDLRRAQVNPLNPLDLGLLVGKVRLRRLDLVVQRTPLPELLALDALAGLEHLGVPGLGPNSPQVLAGACAVAPPRRLRSLALGSADATEAFTNSPWLGQLRELTVRGSCAAVLPRLCRSPAAGGLRRLRLESPGLLAGPTAFGHHLARIEVMEFATTQALSAGAGLFLHELPNLRELHLQGINEFEDAYQFWGLRAWPHLRTFELDGKLEFGRCRDLFRPADRNALRRLRVPEALPSVLTACPQLAELSSQRFRHDRSWFDAPDVPGHPALTALDLPGRAVGLGLARRLADPAAFPRLAALDLRGADLSAEVRAVLARRLGAGLRHGAKKQDLLAHEIEHATAREYLP
jgi:uncharacterized protein (TIGR02996 family)